MCGIAGLIQFNTAFSNTGALQAMTDVIRHRGPNDVGYIFGNTRTGDFTLRGDGDTPQQVFDQPSPFAPAGHVSNPIAETSYNLGMSNRRLAIVDLSPLGHQPMCNEDRSLWVVFNGELYNAPELRADLALRGHRFISAADTEVILHAYEEWGNDYVAHFNGMWAIALWDIQRRRLILSRDRVGIKPLYYWHDAHRFAFASEIKSLLTLDLPQHPNYRAIYDFLTTGQTDHTDMTFFEGIRPLLPAHTISIDLDNGQTSHHCYWSVDLSRQLDIQTDEHYAETFRALFEDAVRLHLISDVPVGTCLSGGLDSSSLVCVINRLIGMRGLHVVGMETQQKTFSARYHDYRYDEGRYIDAVVRASGVDASMIYPTPEDLQENWAMLFYHLEEPFLSTSIFAQWNVFKLARAKGMTVTLDGQGGDELLAGYPGFFPYYFADLATHLRWPQLITEFYSHATLHHRNKRREIRNLFTNLLPARLKLALKKRDLNRPNWLSSEFFAVLEKGIPSQEKRQTICSSRLTHGLYEALTVSPLPALLRFDDRNSMAHSIESRVPFLDYRLIEFCFALPAHQKIRNGTTKYVLRQAMAGIIPEDVRQRQDKIGFSTPQEDWLRGPLVPWIRQLFESAEFRQRPYFQVDEILQLLDRHSNNRENHSDTLWRCIAIELWHRAMQV